MMRVPPDLYLPIKVTLKISLIISGVCSLLSLWLQSYSSHLHIRWSSQTVCTVSFSACWVIRFVMSFVQNKIT